MDHRLVPKVQVKWTKNILLSFTSDILNINNLPIGGASPYGPHGGAPGLFFISG